ncbi:MAG TPA: ATPase domain-containing protein [Candidatus Binatia bacterium]|nr:ATPase domain-containing protein [Candidatus Binatia bacterium]
MGRGIDAPETEGLAATTSLCIIGPDGAGKSILALHLASRYLADAGCQPRVIYASTDLPYANALGSWHRFALHVPNARRVPFEGDRWTPGPDLKLRLEILARPPFELANELSAPTTPQAVVFLNLASATAGDDWGFLNRMLASLPAPGGWPHLLIIDTVEGLETLVGERDTFGQRRTRRSRIAQVMRSAYGKAHLVFVVEEPRADERLPEEFVTDRVIRLRNVLERGYQRRTIEIVKARGRSHVRGQHIVLIRDGRGSTTGQQDNADDPSNPYPGAYADRPDYLVRAEQPVRDAGPFVQSYVHVCHSLHRRTRARMEQRGNVGPALGSPEPITFGIEHLDDMVRQAGGIPGGKAFALIGDHGTYKSRLGRAFLSRCFDGGDGPDRWGVAVLLTSRDVRDHELAAQLASLASRPDRREQLRTRILCRHLEAHDIGSPVFAHIVDELVRRAKEILGPARSDHWNIRFVIDDWSAIRAAHHELRTDPLLLPFLVLYLNRAQISALFIDTEPGRPDLVVSEPADRMFRAMIDDHLYTWHVPFFGERRVAISAGASTGGTSPTETVCDGASGRGRSRRVLVRELRPADGDPTAPDRLEVDPHFELYTGLERGAPEMTPLEMRLFAETPAVTAYLQRVEAFLREVFRPASPEGRIVSPATVDDYDRLHETCHLQTDTRLDHTLVFEIDEYWAQNGCEGLHDLGAYISAETYAHGRPNRAVDTFGAFRPGQGEDRGEITTRASYYNARGRELIPRDAATGKAGAYRAPYLWDFGFLLLRSRAWEQNAAHAIVGDVWRALVRIPDAKYGTRATVGWRKFLEATQIVARVQAARGDSTATMFDLGGRTPESYACLVLEVWASEIARAIRRAGLRLGDFHRELAIRAEPPTAGLVEWLTDARIPGRPEPLGSGYRQELYLTMRLLVEVMAEEQFGLGDPMLERAGLPANPSAVAVRHWYSSATPLIGQMKPGDPLVPARLPGSFSVRGDWSLAMARGSRSLKLGERAIDLLSERRAHGARLRTGFGLPTRTLTAAEPTDDALPTALYCIDSSGRMRGVTYGEVRAIGAADDARFGAADGFFWLWRSKLTGYERHTRIWQRWLYRAAAWLNQRRRARSGEWLSGFAVYDEALPTGSVQATDDEDQAMLREFDERCDVLVAELKGTR